MTPSVTGEDSERCSDGAGDIGGLAAEWFPLPFKDNDKEEEEDALELGHGAPHALISELNVTVFGFTPACLISAKSSSASCHLPALSHAEIRDEKVITDRSHPRQTISR